MPWAFIVWPRRPFSRWEKVAPKGSDEGCGLSFGVSRRTDEDAACADVRRQPLTLARKDDG